MTETGKMAFILTRLKHAPPDTVNRNFQMLDTDVPDPQEVYLDITELTSFYEDRPITSLHGTWRELANTPGLDIRHSLNGMHRTTVQACRRDVKVIVIGRSGVKALPKSLLQRLGIAEWVASLV